MTVSPHHRHPSWDRHVVSVLGHGVLLAFSLLASFVLAHNFSRTAEWFFPQFLTALPIFLAVKFIVFSATGQYRHSWRYAGARDALATTLSCALATVILMATLSLFRVLSAGTAPSALAAFPVAVFLIDWLLSVSLVVGARLTLQYHIELNRAAAHAHKRALIIGAGDAGETLLREIQRRGAGHHSIVGFLDDDPKKLGLRIHGVEVLGAIATVRQVCHIRRVDEVLIAMPSAPKKRIRETVQLCEGANVSFRIVPGLSELIEGTVTIESQLRRVRVEDLLHRDPVNLDRGAIGDYLRDKCVLVTGAGGSIGSEMCRQILQFDPLRLVLVDLSENNLFEIDRELRGSEPGIAVVPMLADICDQQRMAAIFKAQQPDIVCHAAAHKHVPMLEAHPGEGLKNNILGTRTLADLAVAFAVQKFVYISTDKAVNPTSIMGCTKRIAEMYVQGLGEKTVTQFITVRFGNVLSSRGSVVPIFREQIAQGGPLTITHPEMTRYFMTIPEAAQLVLQAGAIGRGGEIFLLEMGEPVKIVDLAKHLITLGGLTPNVDIDLQFIGLRPGEKLHEELCMEGEDLADTAHPNIRVWRRRPEDWDALVKRLPGLLALADRVRPDEIKEQLAEVVPEYQPDYFNDAADAAETPRAVLSPR